MPDIESSQNNKEGEKEAEALAQAEDADRQSAENEAKRKESVKKLTERMENLTGLERGVEIDISEQEQTRRENRIKEIREKLDRRVKKVEEQGSGFGATIKNRLKEEKYFDVPEEWIEEDKIRMERNLEIEIDGMVRKTEREERILLEATEWVKNKTKEGRMEDKAHFDMRDLKVVELRKREKDKEERDFLARWYIGETKDGRIERERKEDKEAVVKVAERDSYSSLEDKKEKRDEVAKRLGEYFYSPGRDPGLKVEKKHDDILKEMNEESKIEERSYQLEDSIGWKRKLARDEADRLVAGRIENHINKKKEQERMAAEEYELRHGEENRRKEAERSANNNRVR